MVQRWHGYHIFDKISAKVTIGFGQGSPGKGDQFWVDGVNGSATASGMSPDEPLSTIAAALALCEADRDDYIWVMDCWAQESSWPITVSKALVHILGLALPTNPFPKMNPATDHAVFYLDDSGNHVEIAGFDLSGGDSYGCIYMFASQGCWIHHNWFGHEQAGGDPKYGIQIGHNIQGSLIEHNRFFGDLGGCRGAITEDGIYRGTAGGDNHCAEIRNNQFDGLSIGINLTAADGYIIEGNRFAVTNRANGEAITLQSSCIDTSVFDNLAMYGMLSNGYSYNPYKDLATNPANNWARNWKGNAIVEPIGI